MIARRTFLQTGVAGGAALALPRPARAARRYDIAPKQVAGGLWLIEGAQDGFNRTNGGAISNVVLMESTDGAIVVDTGSTVQMGAEIRAFADARLGGIAAVLVTHHHPDHWFGNAAFDGAPILALPACIALCAQNAQGYSDALYNILGPWMSGTVPLPPDTALDPGQQAIGARRLTLLPLSGHTQSDLAVVDEATGTLIAGDLLFLDRAPSLPDADISGWLAALDALNDLNISGTIPGHGPAHRSSAALAQTRAYLKATHARLQHAADLGLTPAEAIAAGPVPAFATLGANPEEYRRSVVQRWAEYEQAALQEIGAP